jgi:hypothetical protein
MLDSSDAHTAVYRVLDEVQACSCVPPGAKGTIFAVIDRLQMEAPSGEELRRAQEISLALHGLEAALRRSDELGIEASRSDLRLIAAEWINMRLSIRRPISGSLMPLQ